MEFFRKLKNGDEADIPIDQLHPTQPDDGQDSTTYGAVEVFEDNDKLYVQNGNHRYWHGIRTGLMYLVGRKVKNPYTDW